ncbi:MAG: redoxin domain-containing protein [Akkermansiaceae bacterium]|nr:redoxin domain-containing protein [Armatimonadota bacterium]
MTTQADSSSPQRRDAGARNASPLVGKSAPAFVLPDPVTKDSVALESFADQDILLLFLRGTWCPFCVQQLQVLKDNFEKLRGANVAVVAVVCQSQITVQLFLKGFPLPFPLLCDGSRAVAREYGTHYWLSHEGFNLSHPALFILDKTRTVTFAHVGRSMSDLPVSRILEKFVGLLGDDKG